MQEGRIYTILRWVLGSVFIFSGVVKCIDPVGTSVFVEKYLATYSLEALLPAALPIAIALAVAEFTLGQMLLSGRAHRLTAIATTLFMAVFTLVTLLSATVLPIGDCGCFGDAVKLTPWQTFTKNVVLLPMAICLWRGAKAERFNLLSLVVAVVLSLGINLYALRRGPIVDFMPYDEGVNLREAVLRDRRALEEQRAVQLVFRRATTGEELTFNADDATPWTDDDLEYVGTRQNDDISAAKFPFAEFAISNAVGEDVTLDVLGRKSVTLLTIYDVEALERHLDDALRVMGDFVMVVTSASMQRVNELLGTECYSIDAMTLRSVLRSRVGIVELSEGTIQRKCDVRDY